MISEDWLFGNVEDIHTMTGHKTLKEPPTFKAGKVVRTYTEDLRKLLEKLNEEQKELPLQSSARVKIQVAMCKIHDELLAIDSASFAGDGAHDNGRS
jgi:hypothetical protein